MAIKKKEGVPGTPYADQIYARIWLSRDGETYFGHGRIQLLEAIHLAGSISAAAKTMGMSYKKAWTLVDEMNQAASSLVVIREAGGKGGGGTQVTEHGLAIIAAYHGFECRLKAFLEIESAQIQL
jgi:molybdate transport system regulatory protein